MKKTKFIIVGPGQSNSILNELFYEAIQGKIEYAQYINPYTFHNRIIQKIYNFRYKDANRKTFSKIPVEIWNRYSSVLNMDFSTHESVYILYVIGRDVERLYNPKLLEELKNKWGNKVTNILVLLDSLSVTEDHHGWGGVKACFSSFDLVVTFDLEDAKKYGLLQFYDPYYKRDVKKRDNQQETDFFFIGVDKGRKKILCQIAENAAHHGLSCDFRIFSAEETIEENGVSGFTKFLPYEQMLGQMLNAKCLVEILAEGQSSSSLRFYEAVAYNKLLLTNNKNVKTMPFYNPEYMQVFDYAEDIDFEWLKRVVSVDYHYTNEFSLTKLFEIISNYSGK